MQTLKQISAIEIASMLLEYAKKQKKFTIESLLKDINLEKKYFAILVNGVSVKDLNTEIKETDNIVILPKIAGG